MTTPTPSSATADIDIEYPTQKRSKPTGLALVLLCAEHLQPKFDTSGKQDDRQALETFVDALLAIPGRITASKPTPESENMLGRLTDDEMDVFKERLKRIRDAVVQADRETDPVKACKSMAKVFGDDFPGPDENVTAKATMAPAILTSSSSA